MTFLKIFILFFNLFLINSTFNFPKIIWTYWQTNFQQAPLIVKVSYQKLRIAAQQQNWTVILVNKTNAKDYITEYDRFINVVQNGYRNSIQQKSDILRITLIEQNGGMWMDFACILFQDLSWLNDWKGIEKLLVNRMGNNMDDPDVMFTGQGSHQSRLSRWNQNNSLVTQEYFGTAIYCIAAKKKTRLLTQWKQNMYRLCRLTYAQVKDQFFEQKLWLNFIWRPDMYYSGNIALEQVIQRRQFQLDRGIGLFTQRQNVYEFYKMWGIHGEVGPSSLTRTNDLLIQDLFMLTREQVQERTGKLYLFLKIAAFVRDDIQERLKKSSYYLFQKKVTFQSILKRGPNTQECQLSFLLQGSILHNFFSNSSYLSEVYTPAINLTQRNSFRSLCQVGGKYGTQKYADWSYGDVTKAKRQIFYNQNNTIVDQIKIFLMSNNIIWLKAILPAIQQVFILILIVFLAGLLKLFVIKSINKINHSQSANKQSQPTTPYSLQPFISLNQISRQKVFLILLMKLSSYIIASTFSTCIKQWAGFPQYFQTLLVIAYDYLINISIKTLITTGQFQQLYHHSNTTSIYCSLLNISQIFKITQFLTNIYIGFITIYHLEIVLYISIYHTCTVILIGLLLRQVVEKLSPRRNFPQSYNVFHFVKGCFDHVKICLVVFFVVLNVIPNLRYLTYNEVYIKEKAVYLAYYLVIIAFVLILIGLIMRLIRVFSSVQSSDGEYNYVQIRKSKNLFILLQMVIISGIFYRAYKTNVLISSLPWSITYHDYFSVLILFMFVFYLSIRVSINEAVQKFNLQNLGKCIIVLIIYAPALCYILYEVTPQQILQFCKSSLGTKLKIYIPLIVQIVILLTINMLIDDKIVNQKSKYIQMSSSHEQNSNMSKQNVSSSDEFQTDINS